MSLRFLILDTGFYLETSVLLWTDFVPTKFDLKKNSSVCICCQVFSLDVKYQRLLSVNCNVVQIDITINGV